MKQLRKLGGLPIALTALLTVVALAGCPAAMNQPIGFAAEKLTLSPIEGVEHTPISGVTLPEAMGGDGTFTYRLTPEVPGLTFDAATRVLSGTPTMAGSYSMTYTATDSAGTKTYLRFTVTVMSSISSFRGTWQATFPWQDEHGELIGTYVETLTFTVERYIVVRSHYLGGAFDHYWNYSGTWEHTDSTITRIWEENDDDDGRTPGVERRVSKNYHWIDARKTLCMQVWHDEQERLSDPLCVPYDRVENPLPSPPIGTWRSTTFDEDRTMIIRGDGTLRIDVVWRTGTDTTTAKFEFDEENYYLTLKDATYTWTPTGGAPEHRVRGTSEWVPRVAYAPTDRSPDEMQVSSAFVTEDPDSPYYRQYGGYHRTFRRE